MQNACVRELCGVMEEAETVDENLLRWFKHIERMEGSRFIKMEYYEKSRANRPVG